MITQQFDAAQSLQVIRTYRTVCKQKAYQQSCLHKYRAELVALKQHGGSWRELALWLKQHKRRQISHTTIMRYLKKLPELNSSRLNTPQAKQNEKRETCHD